MENSKNTPVKIIDLQFGDELISKQGTKVIFKRISLDHPWCVICEITENTKGKNPLLKGEFNYFDPNDLYRR